MFDPLAGLIVVPLAWATLTFVLGPRRGAWTAIFALAAQFWLAFDLAQKVRAGGTALHAVGGWGAPLGIDLAVDGLSAAMLLLTQSIALPLAVYARTYFKVRADHPTGLWFWPLLGFLIAGLNALFVSTDLFNLYVTLELVGLAAVALVAAGGGAQQIAAALRYLFATLVGSGAYLLGVALIYGVHGTVAISTLQPLLTVEAPRLVWIAGLLMLAGLMLKTALFPFHFWLPPAHGGAAAPVSALLSALVVKASFYLILRLWLGPFAALVDFIAWLPAALGATAVLWGSWQALRAARLKALVAWSTVAQIGYLFLIFPLLGDDRIALHAGGMQVMSHGLAKAAMFAAAGIIVHTTGRDAVADVAGVASRLPVTLFAFGLAGMTLMGLPPSGGFLAKWLLIEAALARGRWEMVIVVLAGGLLAAAYTFRVLRQAFLLPPSSERRRVERRPIVVLEWTAFALAAASVAIGLRGMEIVQLLDAGT